jgi:hypothetical protein
MKGYVSKELIKTRTDELQSDVDRVKSELVKLKESSRGNVKAEDMQRLDELTRELVAYKSGIAELISLLN